MNKVIIVYDCDNGYTCSCCGKTWEESEVYNLEDDADVTEFVKENLKDTKDYYARNQYGRYDIINAYLIKEEIKF